MINDFEVEIDLNDFLKALAEEGKKELQERSPKRSGGGSYAKGWAYKKVRNGFIIYNKKHAPLTHLLENGHLSKKLNWVKGQAHVRPMQQKLEASIKNKAKLIKIIAK